MNQETSLKQVIEANGGHYVGIWKFPGNPIRDLVLFNDKTGNTRALYLVEFSAERVKEKLAIGDAA